MNKHSPLYRKLNRMCCRSGGFNCFALRISRSLDEAYQALPANYRRCNRCEHHGPVRGRRTNIH